VPRKAVSEKIWNTVAQMARLSDSMLVYPMAKGRTQQPFWYMAAAGAEAIKRRGLTLN